MIDVFCSKQLDLLLLVDSPVGLMQIDTYVTRSNQTQTLNPGFRKTALRQQPVRLYNGVTFRPIPVTELTSRTGDRPGYVSAMISCDRLSTTTGLSMYTTEGLQPYFSRTKAFQLSVYSAWASACDFQR